ncbi:hypothetical protein FHU23_002908 [Clostridium saccharobutylicum]|nr:hypothetical protein [Clostridium saccharobutylicum]MBA9000140.1 hypothetical protein [Clostridium saccharobutylicum]NOV81515.1 hypothetical protein [Clostridium saccharobutylicum]NOV86090.1 hypothetical protein [Clostridium saccharobutylicum]NOW11504.1 hypothetical protein [Clostridium saccharobutylicum]
MEIFIKLDCTYLLDEQLIEINGSGYWSDDFSTDVGR